MAAGPAVSIYAWAGSSAAPAGASAASGSSANSARTRAINRAAVELGVKVEDPLMVLSFLALPVIPKLKLTDMGLVDVERFEFVDLFVDGPDR